MFILCMLVGCSHTVNNSLAGLEFSEPISCNAIEGNSLIQYSNGCLYFYNIFPNMPGGQPEGRTLMRVRVETGTLESVCSTPDCPHNIPECPYYGMIPVMFVDGDRLVSTTLTDSPVGLKKTIISVNLETGRKTTLDDSAQNPASVGSEILFIKDAAYLMTGTTDPDTGESTVTAFRWDIDTNLAESLRVFRNPDYSDSYNLPYRICFMLNGRVYYIWNHALYSASLDFSNEKLIRDGFNALDLLTDGEHIYYGIQSEGHRENIETLYMADADLQNETNLGITAERGKIHLTNDWIYWTEYDEITLGKCRVTGYDSDELVLEGSEIWRCRHDGTEKELVFRFDGDLAGTRFLYDIIVGDELYGIYTTWTDTDGDGIFRDGDQTESIGYDEYFIMKIHIPSGDVSIIDGILK